MLYYIIADSTSATRESVRNILISVKEHFVLCKVEHLHLLTLCAFWEEQKSEPLPPLERVFKVIWFW